MNLTFTGELWGMPVILIGQATQDSSIKITDWLPLVVVIVGGILTYYTAIVLERRKRKFDLRREIYFQAVELFSEISLFEQEMKIDLERQNPEIEDDQYELDEGYRSRWVKWSNDKNIIGKLILIKNKLKLCETPNYILENIDRLKDNVSDIGTSTTISDDITKLNDLIILILVPALSEEISRESIWQFWK